MGSWQLLVSSLRSMIFQADAKKALLACDGTDLHGFSIAVAISDPPARKPDLRNIEPKATLGRPQPKSEG